ncbi:TPA: ferredoxin reductase, partial [Klebsiella quasipneumoniae subsp. similipneumoniae]|nr:ferredoxin reductase [Klebsiella quasipneumoniae subsp. similipneumoniae]
MHSHDFISVSVGEIRPNGEGNLSLILQAAAGEILPAYSAGAHIDIIIPGVGPRQYSLCGMPDRGNRYEVCVRLADASTGGSRYLHQQLKAGDRLSISQPRNHFPLPQAGRYLLFAGGIGITPLLAMADAIAARKGELELHYYVASSRQTAFSPRLAQLAASGTVAIHCSEEGESFRQQIPPCLTAPDPDTAVVACGPEGFIQRLRSVMDEYRWSPSQFVFERFTPAAENNTAAKNAFYIELASSGQR